jgi:hydroxyacylglutathione hydrolase
MPLEIEQFVCGSDNFGVLIHDAQAGVTAAIDTPKEAPILEALDRTGWKLTHILTTHWHGDHVEGHLPLKQKFGVEIIGPEAEKAKIPGIDRTVKGGDTFEFGNYAVEVINTPGHTAGHITYHIPAAKVAFTGDTLFSLGCGRLFEAGAEIMFKSLEKLTHLPSDTRIYCGHEYTASNAKFALTVDPGNAALQARAKEVERLRAAGKPTLPTMLGRELETNPFLRWDDPAIRGNLGMENAENWQVLAEIRKRKDAF